MKTVNATKIDITEETTLRSQRLDNLDLEAQRVGVKRYLVTASTA